MPEERPTFEQLKELIRMLVTAGFDASGGLSRELIQAVIGTQGKEFSSLLAFWLRYLSAINEKQSSVWRAIVPVFDEETREKLGAGGWRIVRMPAWLGIPGGPKGTKLNVMVDAWKSRLLAEFTVAVEVALPYEHSVLVPDAVFSPPRAIYRLREVLRQWAEEKRTELGTPKVRTDILSLPEVVWVLGQFNIEFPLHASLATSTIVDRGHPFSDLYAYVSSHRSGLSCSVFDDRCAASGPVLKVLNVLLPA